ncbi:MAG: alpha-L-fucosidase [Sedimentisphaerales bacterium]|nr:alpha-L-fucosidase [Sedimentisphaerales bacterium]
MHRSRDILRSLIVVVLCAIPVGAAIPSPDPYANETPQQRDQRMRWWREARFGMFIHWGVYSVPAGIYKGKQIPGIGEWIMFNAKIPVAEYEQFATQFNPVKYDPEQWVLLAKEAGMRYIVITSKHHDGFALFDSQASDWNVVKATPYGKDLLRPLAEACQRHGIKLGLYYSQAQDWTNPGGGVCGQKWDKAQEGDMDEYIRNVAVPQVREILSNYGPIAILWWDTPCGMTRQMADQLIALLALQPGIIHNNRLGGGYAGDTETPEQYIPATGMPGRDFEVCMTMNDTWGYKSYDQNWKSTQTLVRNLIDIASKGGNYLLNVGPTSEGLIPEPSVQRLREIGAWMKVNGQAIYATTASPFRRLVWGRCTKKVLQGRTILYLHVFDWPKDGRLVVPGLRNKAISANLLADGRSLACQQDQDGMIIQVPTGPQDPISTTVVLEIEGKPVVENPPIRQAKDGTVRLDAIDAIVHGTQMRYEQGHDRDCLGYWTDPGDWAEWEFELSRPGGFELRLDMASLGPSAVQVTIGDQTVAVQCPATGDYGKFVEVKAGQIQIQGPGRTRLIVRAVKDGWQPVNLRRITLVPR